MQDLEAIFRRIAPHTIILFSAFCLGSLLAINMLQHVDKGMYFHGSVLQSIDKLLLLLEDVLELSKGGFHLLKGELVLTLGRFVLGDPGVEFGDSVVKEGPFLEEGVDLLGPFVRDGLDLVVSLLEGSDLLVSLVVSGHLLGSSISSIQDLEVGVAALGEGGDLVVQSLDLIEVGGLGETLSARGLRAGQPGVELLDSSSVLSPEFDILGVLVALSLGLGLEVSDVLGDSVELILEVLSVLGNLVTLGKEFLLSGSVLDKNFHLGSNVFLEVHGSGNSVLREHASTLVSDIIKFSSGSILPAVNGSEGSIESRELVAELLKLVNLLLESASNLKLLANSLDFLLNNLLLVLREGDAHALEVAVDAGEQGIDGVVVSVEDILSLLEVIKGRLEVEPFLDLLHLILSLVKFRGNALIVLSISNPGILGFLEELESVLSLLLGVIPSNFDTLDMSLKELGFVGVLKNLLAFVNGISDDTSLGLKLNKRLLLSLNELINILNTGRSDVSGGGHHDSIKEFNMGLQLITIGIAFPVQINHNLGLGHGRNEFFVLLDKSIEFVAFALLLILGSLSHQDLEDLGQPFLDFGPFQIFAQSVEVISLPLKFGGSVDFVGHDTSDGLLDVLHPLCHLLVAHVVDILDEVVVLLPERHLDPELLLPGVIGMSICLGISGTHSPC